MLLLIGWCNRCAFEIGYYGRLTASSIDYTNSDRLVYAPVRAEPAEPARARAGVVMAPATVVDVSIGGGPPSRIQFVIGCSDRCCM